MRDVYLTHGKSKTFGDKSKGGLFSCFLKEYKEHFKRSVIPSCGKCLAGYWRDYTNIFTEMKKEVNCLFRLKAKYNGIQIGANGQPIRNGEMDDETAVKLLEWHPAHEELFDRLPSEEELEALGSDENLSLTRLRDRYPNIKSNSKDGFLKKLVEFEASQEDNQDSDLN